MGNSEGINYSHIYFIMATQYYIYIYINVMVKQLLYRPITSPEGSRILMLPDFEAIDT
jgi:hypothetical protein